METEDRVKVLEDELKLIKSELKQTLVGVRDFLLDLKIPPMQEEISPSERKEQLPETEMPAPSKPASDENLPDQTPQNRMPEVEDLADNGNQYSEPDSEMIPATDAIPDEEYPGLNDDMEDRRLPFKYASPKVEVPPDEEDDGMTSGDIPVENEPEMKESKAEEVSDMRIDESRPSTSQVNLLANLIRWVSRAKKEIGTDQLKVFLDVYAIGGGLSQEMQDVIIHLSEVATDPEIEANTYGRNEITDENIALCVEINNLSGQLTPELREDIRRLTSLVIQQSVRVSKADVWSQLLLELHGILTGGGTGLHLAEPEKEIEQEKESDTINETGIHEDNAEMAESSLEETSTEEFPEETEEEPEEPKGAKPAILRLVMPQDDGSEQELDLGSLFIAKDSTIKKGNGHKSVSISKG